MSKIASTAVGNNAIVIGLMSHGAALLMAMMPASGAGYLFSVLYPLYWILFVLGLYKEMHQRSLSPLGAWRFYAACAATIIPILGPLAALITLYSMQGNSTVKQDRSPGFFSSLAGLRANSLLIVLFVVILFLLFAMMSIRNDPYFKRRVVDGILPGAAFAAETAEATAFVSDGTYFSIHIPAGWEKDENILSVAHKEYGVRLRAPGLNGLGYVLIDIVYYGEQHRTPERFIFDKLNPAWSPRSEERGTVKDLTVAGMQAKTFEIGSTRHPIAGIGDAPVAAREQYVVVPAAKGFFALSFHAPVQIVQDYRRHFEAVLQSFKPASTVQPAPGKGDGVTEEEYKVYTDFFSIKDAPRIDSPVPLPFPSKGGLVYEKTSSGKKKGRDLALDLEKSFGKLPPSLIDSYSSRNAKEWHLTDKVLVQHVRILSETSMDEIRKKGGLGRGFAQELARRHPLGGEIIYLSRVGFDKDMKSALFSAGISSGVMGGGYTILMENTGKAWKLKDAVLNDFWYH